MNVSFKFDVEIDAITENRICQHGPLLALRNSGNGKLYYRCSAFRDNKSCKRNDAKSRGKSGQKRSDLWKNLRTLMTLPKSERIYCEECSLLLSKNDLKKHVNHKLKIGLTKRLLRQPSKLITPFHENKNEAQYFFDEKTLRFVCSTLKMLNFKNVICVGTPTVHEYLRCNEIDVKCILLDIDWRYTQFYTTKSFLCYNMFNNYFLEGKEAISKFESFLRNCTDKTVILIDPPFGGLIKALVYSVNEINKTYKQLHANNGVEELPMLLFFPYFNEKHINREMSSLRMLDYKVGYENHSKFSVNQKRSRKQGSPVRIFTNMDASVFVLPESEGYKWCEICRRYVSAENKHCFECNKCTSKDGRESIHCYLCAKCVKNTWKHCDVCGFCCLPHIQHSKRK